MARATTYERDEDENDGEEYTSILKRSRKDITPPALIPQGTWVLRCLGGKAKKFHDDEADKDIMLVTLVHEPFQPTSSVDPDEAASDSFDGRRLFTKFYLRNRRAENDLARAMDAHFDEAEDGEGSTLEEDLEAMKGKLVLGRVETNTYFSKREGKNVSDSVVRQWARNGD